MLELLQREIEAAQERQQSQLEMSVRLAPSPTDLRVRGTRANVSEQLGLSGIQAFTLLERLERDGYVNARIERPPLTYMGRAVVYSLTGPGLSLIGRLPEPNAQLLEALDVLAEAIEGLQDVDVDPASKAQAKDAANSLKRIFRDVPSGIVVDVLSRIATVLGIPGG
jgi:predicted ArsR family transcriptional regulator